MKAYFHFEQYSDQWWQARRGIPTASEFGRIITPKKAELAAAHKGYLCKLIGDRFDPLYPRVDKIVNEHMREGTRREPESCDWYALEQDADLKAVGFVTTDDGRFGCSPDRLVGEDGVLQVKNPTPEVHIGYCLADELPADYVPQCYGELFVTGRKWLDFVSYCPGMPQQFRKRIYPEGPFWDALAAVLEQFHSKLAEALARFTAEAA